MTDPDCSLDLLEPYPPRCSVGTARSYRIKLPSGDSMIALVDDESGLLVIYEYDGCWGHRWDLRHLGGQKTPDGPAQSLTSFVRQASAGYLADKLVPSDKKFALDEPATIAAHREAAAEAGLAGDEFIRDEIDTADWDDVEAGRETDPLDDVVEDAHNLLVYSDSRWLKMVRDVCIPALKAALGEIVAHDGPPDGGAS